MLEVQGLDLVYANNYQVLWAVSLEVKAGEIVCILGPNGAGKSSLMNTISGLRRPTRGSIRFDGQEIGGTRPDRIVHMGLSHVLERRRLFPSLTVLDNLLLGAISLPRQARHDALDWVLEMVPLRRDLLSQVALTLSGGQQQMVAIARGLMSRPRLLMCDEPFLGLAPSAMLGVLETFRRVRETGVTVLFIEQNVEQALEVSDRGYILESGAVVLSGVASEIAQTKLVQEVYLGAY